jgi:hypothetical protein
LFDESVFDKKTTIRQFGVVVIHGEEMGVFDEESGHLLLAISRETTRLHLSDNYSVAKKEEDVNEEENYRF